MAGSNKYFVYITDQGGTFALLADESNIEAVNGTGGDYTGSPVLNYEIPKNIRVRTATYQNAVRSVTVPVLDPTDFASLPATIDDPVDSAGGTMTLRRTRGQRTRIPIAVDTGQTDGDAT